MLCATHTCSYFAGYVLNMFFSNLCKLKRIQFPQSLLCGPVISIRVLTTIYQRRLTRGQIAAKLLFSQSKTTRGCSSLNLHQRHIPLHSSSSCVSFISGKSNKSASDTPNPCDMRCNVRNPGLFVFPLIMLSTVDCFKPDRVASLFTVMFLSLHMERIRFEITSEYVNAPTSLLPKFG